MKPLEQTGRHRKAIRVGKFNLLRNEKIKI